MNRHCAFFILGTTVYPTADLLSYIENCVAELSHDYPLADIILAGDLNQLHDDDVVERTGLTQIVSQPTRSASLYSTACSSLTRTCTAPSAAVFLVTV